MSLLENDRVCKKMGHLNFHAWALGTQCYSTDIHVIRMKVESKYDTFMGIVTADILIPKLMSNTVSTHGWWTGGGAVVNGKVLDKHRWINYHQENDIYSLAIDCDRHSLEIMNERTHMYCNGRLLQHEIDINQGDDMKVDFVEAPHPWMLFVLLRKGQIRLM